MKISTLFAILLLTIAQSNTSHAEGRSENLSIVQQDSSLKKIIKEEPNAKRLIKLYNFNTKKEESVNFLSTNHEDFHDFMPENELFRLAYMKYIEKGYLPIIALQEASRLYIESLR